MKKLKGTTSRKIKVNDVDPKKRALIKNPTEIINGKEYYVIIDEDSIKR